MKFRKTSALTVEDALDEANKKIDKLEEIISNFDLNHKLFVKFRDSSEILTIENTQLKDELLAANQKIKELEKKLKTPLGRMTIEYKEQTQEVRGLDLSKHIDRLEQKTLLMQAVKDLKSGFSKANSALRNVENLSCRIPELRGFHPFDAELASIEDRLKGIKE